MSRLLTCATHLTHTPQPRRAPLTDRALALCKMVGHRMWGSQNPLRQFKGLPGGEWWCCVVLVGLWGEFRGDGGGCL